MPVAVGPITASTFLVSSSIASDAVATGAFSPPPSSAIASLTGLPLIPPAALIWLTAISTGVVRDLVIGAKLPLSGASWPTVSVPSSCRARGETGWSTWCRPASQHRSRCCTRRATGRARARGREPTRGVA